MDVLTPQQRHKCMSRIRGKNTKPEMIVRKSAHKMGYRFRIHRKDLPGKPDLVFPRLRKVIFVHGCYWHMHDCQYGSVIPKTNTQFWQNKRQSNVDRDKKNMKALKKLGWKILVVWECKTKKIDSLHNMLFKFLSK